MTKIIQKIQALFEDITEKVENNPTPFVMYVQLFLALLAVRLTLEFYANQRLFNLMNLWHIGLWFVFIVMAFLVQLHLFSGVPILKVAKLVITFFSFSLSAPLIDLVVFRGEGVEMSYLSISGWSDFGWSYLTIGGASLHRGATLGIRIEIVLLVITCFHYVRTKRNSILQGLIAGFSIYTILFLSGAIPFMMNFLYKYLPPKPDSDVIALLFLCLDAWLVFFSLYRHEPAFFRLMRVPWYVISLAIIYATIGAYQARMIYPKNWALDIETLFHFPLLICIGFCLAKATENRQMLGVLAVLGLVISYKTLFTVWLSWAILFILYEPPLHFSKVPFLSHILSALLFVSFSLIGFCAFGGVLVGFPTVYLLILFTVALSGSFLFNPQKIKKLN